MQVAVILLINPSSPSLFVSLKCSNRLFSLTLGLSGNGWSSVCLQVLPLISGGTVYCWRCLAQAASLSCTDVELGAQRAKGWHFDGHNRSENTDWDDGGAALHVWEMGTWWDWLEEEIVLLTGLWNGEFPLRLSIVQARLLQSLSQACSFCLQLAHFKSRL